MKEFPYDVELLEDIVSKCLLKRETENYYVPANQLAIMYCIYDDKSFSYAALLFKYLGDLNEDYNAQKLYLSLRIHHGRQLNIVLHQLIGSSIDVRGH